MCLDVTCKIMYENVRGNINSSCGKDFLWVETRKMKYRKSHLTCSSGVLHIHSKHYYLRNPYTFPVLLPSQGNFVASEPHIIYTDPEETPPRSPLQIAGLFLIPDNFTAPANQHQLSQWSKGFNCDPVLFLLIVNSSAVSNQTSRIFNTKHHAGVPSRVLFSSGTSQTTALSSALLSSLIS